MLAFTLTILAGGNAFAGYQEGQIDRFQIPVDSASDGVCIRMAPMMPGPGYACLRQDSPLYEEGHLALFEAYLNERTVGIEWYDDQDCSGSYCIKIIDPKLD